MNVCYFIIMNDLLQKISSHCLNFPGILYSTIKLCSKCLKEHFSFLWCCTCEEMITDFFRTLNHFDVFRQLSLFKVCFTVNVTDSVKLANKAGQIKQHLWNKDISKKDRHFDCILHLSYTCIYRYAKIPFSQQLSPIRCISVTDKSGLSTK